MSIPHASRIAAVGAVLAALTLTAACASAGPAPGRSGASTVNSSPISTSPTASAATSPPTSPGATASAPTTSTAPSSSAAPSASTAPVLRSTCPSLTIRVIRGSAAPGYEFAALQFVNTGTTRCVLNGYPSVTLLLSGATVGRPSSPASAATSRFTLEPGATAESRLKDFSSCQAPLSDQIRVVAPGSSMTTTRTGQLRACRLTVSALATPE